MPTEIPLRARLRAMRPTAIRALNDAKPPGAIDLGLGQPVVDAPPELVAAASAALPGWASYSANAGLPALRERIAASEQAEPDGVIVTAGSAQAIFLVMAGLLEVGDEVLVPDPGYPAYARVASLCGAEAHTYPLLAPGPDGGGFTFAPESVLARLTPRTKLVVLNTPSNPCGAIPDPASLRLLFDELARRGVPYLSDEVYAAWDFRSVAQPFRARAFSDHGFVVGSLSKSHALMGWRLGWLVGPASSCRALIPLQQLTVTCAPVPMQHAALLAFSPAGTAAAARLRDELAQRRTRAVELVAQLPDVPPPSSQGGLYLFVDVRAYPGATDERLAFALLRHGVVVVPGNGFGEQGAGFLRLSYGATPTALDEGLRRLAAGLAHVRTHGLEPSCSTTPF